jgi:hypothetical protein
MEQRLQAASTGRHLWSFTIFRLGAVDIVDVSEFELWMF